MNYIIKKESLTTIADAIREKTGKNDLLNLNEMPAEIAAIETGAELNFDVVGGITQPSSASENTIWVNTSNTITSWGFSATELTEPLEGMVWFLTSTFGDANFNALKKNSIQVYPLSVKQYISGVWVDKTAKSYQNGEWVKWWNGELYDAGNEYFPITGWNDNGSGAGDLSLGSVTKNADSITIECNGQTAAVGPVKAIDLTDFNKLCVNITSISNKWRTGYLSVSKARDTNTYKERVANVVLSKSGVATLDITNLSGEYYVYVGYWAYNGFAESLTFNKMWLER